jgi:hypothetical protein
MKLPLEAGLWDDDEQQIVDADEQEIGWINEPNPTDEIANYIIKCVNAHDELVRVVEAALSHVELDDTESREFRKMARAILNKLT